MCVCYIVGGDGKCCWMFDVGVDYGYELIVGVVVG